MAKITIATKDGIVMGQIDTSEYDLKKSIARAALLEEIIDAVECADVEDENTVTY